jgi:hypothetical protein
MLRGSTPKDYLPALQSPICIDFDRCDGFELFPAHLNLSNFPQVTPVTKLLGLSVTGSINSSSTFLKITPQYIEVPQILRPKELFHIFRTILAISSPLGLNAVLYRRRVKISPLPILQLCSRQAVLSKRNGRF